MIPSAIEFLEMTKTKEQNQYRLGKIDSAYTSGRPSLIFDGETAASTKQYPYLSSYTPTAGDRVLLLRISGSYVILGKII